MKGHMFTAADGTVHYIGEHTFRVESEHVAMCGEWAAAGKWSAAYDLVQFADTAAA